MASKEVANHIGAVAIDFGTSFCGYGFSLTSNPSDIFVPNDWGLCLGIESALKTPTSVLLDSKGNFIALGYEAIYEYADKGPTNPSSYRFFDQFKMIIHDQKDLSEATAVFDHSEKKFSALKIFSMVLKELASKAIKKIRIQTSLKVEYQQFRWVITVPAIWTDGAKHFMRKAAVEAGIVGNISSTNLLLALEPEVASIWCQKSALNSFDEDKMELCSFKIGEQYQLLDLGGGTLDAVVHEVLEDSRLTELCITNGGPIGSTMIDKAFLNLVDEHTGPSFTKEFKKNDPMGFNQWFNKFEVKKRAFMERSTERLEVEVSVTFLEFYEERFHRKLKDVISSSPNSDVSLRSGMLVFQKSYAYGIFKEYTSKVTSHLKTILQNPEMKEVRKIVAVGGPSNSVVIKKTLEAMFPKHTVFVPKDAWSTVLKGAVLFGHNPDHIRSRIIRKTYGYSSMVDYIAGKHPSERKIVVDGREKVCGKFMVFVKRGETIEPDQPKKRTARPALMDQQSIMLRFYATLKDNPEFVDEEGVEEIGRLKITLPGKGKDRPIEIIMWFGDTNIKVEARDNRDPDSAVQIELDCFTH